MSCVQSEWQSGTDVRDAREPGRGAGKCFAFIACEISIYEWAEVRERNRRFVDIESASWEGSQDIRND